MVSNTSNNTKRLHQRGIATLEFVIILPVLLILLFGVIEYGWLLTKSGELVNAAREGARVGAREGATLADINAAINGRMADAGMTGFTANITEGVDAGDLVTVELTVPYDGGVELTGFALIPVPANLRAQVTMNKEGP